MLRNATVAVCLAAPLLLTQMIGTSMAAPLAAMPEVAAASTTAQVNLNTATAAELAQALVGVGIKRAEAIIALRTEIGRFTAVEQLLDVKGIGPKMIEKNQHRVTF